MGSTWKGSRPRPTPARLSRQSQPPDRRRRGRSGARPPVPGRRRGCGQLPGARRSYSGRGDADRRPRGCLTGEDLIAERVGPFTVDGQKDTTGFLDAPAGFDLDYISPGGGYVSHLLRDFGEPAAAEAARTEFVKRLIDREGFKLVEEGAATDDATGETLGSYTLLYHADGRELYVWASGGLMLMAGGNDGDAAKFPRELPVLSLTRARVA